MKHTHFLKSNYSDTTAFSLADFSAQFNEQRFDIAPLNVPTCWSSEDQFESALVLSSHIKRVPHSGTELPRVRAETAIECKGLGPCKLHQMKRQTSVSLANFRKVAAPPYSMAEELLCQVRDAGPRGDD